MTQAPHFLAEMGAMLARKKPDDAEADLSSLMAVEFEVACELAIRLGRHLFDTLYNAVALHTPGAALVTANARYFGKARKLGGIALLADFTL
jgi:predicted nucleic acid-binding protein